MNKKEILLSRADKILLFMHELSGGTKKNFRYEDIVAGIFKKYPEDFHLRGYREYPDSGDLIHKPLYDFKKKGMINASNKIFSLTDRGIEAAKKFKQALAGTSVVSEDRFSRAVENELSRIESLEGYRLFLDGKQDKISDSDLYNYLGATVRTDKNSFIGRMETVKDVVKQLKKNHLIDPIRKKIPEYHQCLFSRYENIIEYFKK